MRVSGGVSGEKGFEGEGFQGGVSEGGRFQVWFQVWFQGEEVQGGSRGFRGSVVQRFYCPI